MAAKTGNTYISEIMTDMMTNPTADLVFSTTPSSKKSDLRRLRQRPTTGNGHLDVLLANLAMSGTRSLSQSFG